jgi:hypothetical protein
MQAVSHDKKAPPCENDLFHRIQARKQSVQAIPNDNKKEPPHENDLFHRIQARKQCMKGPLTREAAECIKAGVENKNSHPDSSGGVDTEEWGDTTSVQSLHLDDTPADKPGPSGTSSKEYTVVRFHQNFPHRARPCKGLSVCIRLFRRKSSFRVVAV